MASTESSAPANGSAHSYDTFQQSQPAQQAAASEIPKDEVGWYFVEQYYTTLSKSPDRLYLFYNKRSQYVSGVEEEKVGVCMGQKPINERIKELDFKDTKVRVTNVDSQGSDANIVIQVIGEISNQGQPHKRFVQTFVLAEQTNGYFVLNDIFRYLAEEPEEEEQQQPEAASNGVKEPVSAAAAPEEKSAQLASSEEDLAKVDDKLEEVAQQEPAPEAASAPLEQAPEVEEAPEAADAPAPAAEAAPSKEPEAPVEEALTVEKPKEPAPTPAPAAAKTASVAMPAAPKPNVPRTWASLAASAHKVATPVVAAPAAQQAPSQAKSVTSSQPAAATSAQAPAPAREESQAPGQGEATGWQTATGHKKEQSRVQNPAPAVDADQKRAYIKNVYSQVEEGPLRAALTKFGELEHLDISRGKNCAFVDFKTPAAYQAAVAANPHTVNGIELKVEERRTRPQQFPPFARGGGAPRGRGGMGGQARGGFQPRGRGGAPRGGRGGAPQEA